MREYSKVYKKHIIERLWPSGYYLTLTHDGYRRADTLKGIKAEINKTLKS